MSFAKHSLFHPNKLGLAIFLCMSAAQSFAAGNIRLDLSANSSRSVGEVDVKLVPREGEPLSYQTDEQGRLLIKGLDAGLYELQIQKQGYLSLRLPSVRVIDDKTTPLKQKLSPVKGQLEEVLVIGNASSGDVLGAVSSFEKDREALRSAAGGGGDVLRSLDGLPGLFSDGEFSSFTVRGNGPRNNLILVDGIPFADVVHFSDSFGDREEVEGGGRYSVFAPNLISKVKYQPGGWEPKYGGLAGSLLQLEVAEGNPDTPSATLRLDIAGLEVGYDGPSYVHDDTSILFSARALDFTRLFEAIDQNDVGEPSLSDVVFKTTTEYDSNKVNALVLYSTEDYKRLEKHAIASDETEVGDYADVSLNQSSKEQALYALSWQHFFANDAVLDQRVYYRYHDEDSIIGEAYPDLSPIGTPADQILSRPEILFSKRGEDELGYRLDFSIPNALGEFSTGLRLVQQDFNFSLDLKEDWINYNYSYRDVRPSDDIRYVVWTPENTNNTFEQSELLYTLYFDQNFSTEAWDYRFGLRYDRDNFSDENIYSPRAAATWSSNYGLRITTTVGRYHQAANILDRARSGSNSGLENEIIDQASIGFIYSFGENMEFSVEPYYQRLSNLVAQPESSLFELVNTGEGRAFGVDTVLSRSFADGWSASISYSYNDAQIKDSPDGELYDADFGRPHSLSLGGIWEINPRWKISARWKFASGTPKDSYIVHENVLGSNQPLRYSREVTAFNTDRYDGFSSLNFRLDYRRAFGRTNLIAFLDIINALGSSNPGNAEFNERTGKLAEEEGEAVPLFGIRLEW